MEKAKFKKLFKNKINYEKIAAEILAGCEIFRTTKNARGTDFYENFFVQKNYDGTILQLQKNRRSQFNSVKKTKFFFRKLIFQIRKNFLLLIF